MTDINPDLLVPPDLMAILSPMERVGWYIRLEGECRSMQADLRSNMVRAGLITEEKGVEAQLRYELLSDPDRQRLEWLEAWIERSRPALPSWFIPDQIEYLRRDMHNLFADLSGKVNWESGEVKVTRNDAYRQYAKGRLEVFEMMRDRVYNVYSRLNNPLWFNWKLRK